MNNQQLTHRTNDTTDPQPAPACNDKLVHAGALKKSLSLVAMFLGISAEKTMVLQQTIDMLPDASAL